MAVLISGRLTLAILPSLNCSSKFRQFRSRSVDSKL
jgi:hypothetical protein